MTASPSSRNRAWQPQIRYAPTTSQMKRLSEPAQSPHGKPSARAACTTSSAVWTSQPIRTPQVASRPERPGLRASPTYATAASPYASRAGQNRSPAIDPPLREPDREERDRDQHDAEQRVDRAEVRALRPVVDGEAEHEVRRVEEEQDEEERQLLLAPEPPVPPGDLRPDRTGRERQHPEDHA